ncbi:MAG: hypothetical protein H0X66_11395 [Verrucomicrobia bacterium]|nr:hypothetical protein [Verrucomicrobiota bacterium]
MVSLLFILAVSSTISLRADVSATRVEDSAIENFFLLTANILSGATPENEQAFAELQKRGVKTIISVDGAKPDAESARKFGIRYVHLPIGYDGISTNRELELIKAVQSLPKPIFVHCHHGKHRGPTAAAILCMGAENWKSTEALQWMKQAGTATNYSGLYRTVELFRVPGATALRTVTSDFPEHAKVSTMVEAMVSMDERFEHLKAVKKAGYKKSESHPDVDPAHEALLLHELFKELLRAPDAEQHTAGFLQELKVGEQTSGAFYTLMKGETFHGADADAAFDKMTQNCASCHRKFRN